MNNNLQPRHLNTFFFSIKKQKNILINLIGIPKIEMIRLSCGFVLCCVQTSHWTQRSFIVETQSQSLFPPLLVLFPYLGDQLFGLQLHLCSPFKGHIHQELEATEVLCEVWRGGGRGIKQPAAGAQVALHAGATEDGGSGGEWLAAWPFIPAPEQHLCGLQQLSSSVTVHSWHRGVGGGRAGLHRCGDSGVTDDRRTSRHEPWRGGRGGWRGYGGGHCLPQDAGHGRFEAGRVENTFVVALVCTCWRTAVFRGLGAVREAVTSFATFPGYGELVGVFAIFPQHLWEKSPPCINEPVAHLVKTTIKKKTCCEKAASHGSLMFCLAISKKICWYTLCPGALCTCVFNRIQRLNTNYHTHDFTPGAVYFTPLEFPVYHFNIAEMKTQTPKDLNLRLWS